MQDLHLMKPIDRKSSTTRIAEISPAAIGHYKDMRAVLTNAPGVDPTSCEIVLACQLAMLGYEVPFKIHASRALALGVSKERMQGLILAGVGLTMLVYQAARALEWLDEACAESNAEKR